VGVDEDGLYLTGGKSRAAHSESGDFEFGSDEEHQEEDRLVGKDPLLPIPVVAYDKEDPPMDVGSIYLKFPTCMSLGLHYLSTLSNMNLSLMLKRVT
jgi:hypothetical protein